MPLVSWASAQVWHSARTVQRADGLGRVDLPGGGAGGDRREEQVGSGVPRQAARLRQSMAASDCAGRWVPTGPDARGGAGRVSGRRARVRPGFRKPGQARQRRPRRGRSAAQGLPRLTGSRAPSPRRTRHPTPPHRRGRRGLSVPDPAAAAGSAPVPRRSLSFPRFAPRPTPGWTCTSSSRASSTRVPRGGPPDVAEWHHLPGPWGRPAGRGPGRAREPGPAPPAAGRGGRLPGGGLPRASIRLPVPRADSAARPNLIQAVEPVVSPSSASWARCSCVDRLWG